MKITKAQIKKIIKEELIKEMALEDADPIKVFGAFALIRVKLDNLNLATHLYNMHRLWGCRVADDQAPLAH